MDKLLYIFYQYRQTILLIIALMFVNYALARLAIVFIEPLIEIPVVSFQPYQAQKANAAQKKDFAYYSNAILNSRLFPDLMTKDNNETNGSNLSTMDTMGPEFKKLGLSLLGTITGPSWFSRAYIKSTRSKDPKEKSGKAYKRGETINGAKLVLIRRDRVKMIYQGQAEWLYLYPKKQKKKPKPNAPNQMQSSRTIKRVMTRGDLQKKVFGNLNNIMKGIAIMPHFQGGKMNGYRIKKIHPSNVLYSLGARSGDIVKAVNGHQIDDIKKVLKLWERVQKENNIRVDILRRGSIISYDFNIRN